MCFSTHTPNKGLPYCTPTWELRWDAVEVGVHCLTVVAFHCVTYDYAVERPPQTGCVMLIMGTRRLILLLLWIKRADKCGKSTRSSFFMFPPSKCCSQTITHIRACPVYHTSTIPVLHIVLFHCGGYTFPPDH